MPKIPAFYSLSALTGLFTSSVLLSSGALLSCSALLASCASGDTNEPTGANATSSGITSAATSTGATTGGTTGGGCLAGQTMCGGSCVALANDPSNCGACGTVCAANQLCSSGVCATDCTVGLIACGQSCVDLMSDALNCGACGTACSAAEACSAGTCIATASTTGSSSVTSTATVSTTATSATSTTGAGGATATTTVNTVSTVTSTTGTVDDGDCMTPPAAPPLIGWASEGGGTVGGGDAAPTVVSSAGELNDAVAGSDARVIHVMGSLSGSFVIGSNKTIIGICGAELQGSVHINNQSNVIMRNLKVVGNNCSENPDDCSAGEDAIGVLGSHHLWFDHLDVSDGSDGNMDITSASDYVTVSYTKFYYSTARTDVEQGESGHRFSNLIGSSDTDSGEYRITFHHNWWAENVDQRMPRSRFGDIHVFNNLFTSSGNSYCTNAGIDTHLLVENNIYRGVNNPLSPDDNGDMLAVGNDFDNVTGNQDDMGGAGFDPPYEYTLDPTAGLDTVLESEVGPHD